MGLESVESAESARNKVKLAELTSTEVGIRKLEVIKSASSGIDMSNSRAPLRFLVEKVVFVASCWQ